MQAFLRAALTKMKAVGCPRPGCPNSLVPSRQSAPQKCLCPCGMAFCSKCQEPFHYGVTCADATTHGVTWDYWLRVGCAKYLAKRAETDKVYAKAFEAYTQKQWEFATELKESMDRRLQLGRRVEGPKLPPVPSCKQCVLFAVHVRFLMQCLSLSEYVDECYHDMSLG